MILKGNQRGYGQNLAAHLMRTDENEHVEIHEIRGFASHTLPMALKEAQAISMGTQCRQYLFSLSLNPPEMETAPVAAFEDAVDRVEKKLGLDGQPRVIVLHEKEGRRHAHCVWSRIDADAMKARQLSHYKLKLQDVSRQLYLDHSWTMPRGLENPALRDPTNFTLAEWQQAKRANVDPREIKAAIQGCWEISDGKATFEHALKERGFFLARGDRRGFVAVDYQGEVYSLTRALGLKAREVGERLGDPSSLRCVTETNRLITERMTPALERHIDATRRSTKHKVAAHAHNKAVMVGEHQSQRQQLDERHKARAAEEAKTRAYRFRKGIRGLWDRMNGRHRKIKSSNEAEAEAAAKRDGQERRVLIERQLRERLSLQAFIKAQRKQQAETLRSLRKDIARYLHMDRPMEPQSNQRRVRGQYRKLGL